MFMKALKKKYELEIKFKDDLPLTPPHFLYHKNICELLSEIHFFDDFFSEWTPFSYCIYEKNKNFFLISLKIFN